MYFNKGKPMHYKEEGAAFFPPVAPPISGLGVVPPRTMGIDMDLLTNGFVPIPGMGAETTSPAPPASPAECVECKERVKWAVWAFVIGAAGGFIWKDWKKS